MARFNLAPSRLARYYFLECDRFLRYDATPKDRRAAEGIPPREFDASPVRQAVLDSGAAWEHAVLTQYLPGAVVGESKTGAGDELTDRTLAYQDSIDALRTAEISTAIYQPTLRAPSSFYERYGLDPDLVTFGDFRPDLLTIVDGDTGPEVRVVDLKASDYMKLSHRIQVGIYTLLLRHILDAEGIDDLGRTRDGGVWLFQKDEPEWFPLSSIVPQIETFLERELTDLLTAPAPEAFWHLYYRCEWCDFYSHCRGEAEASDNVSLVPYLSHFGKRHLEQHGDVETIADLEEVLARDDADDVLQGSASLEGRAGELQQYVEALRSGEPKLTGAHSVAMPKNEGVRLVLTLQEDPLTGDMFGYAIARQWGKDVFGDHRDTIARVASDGSIATLQALRRDLVSDLMGILQPIHDHNSATDDWWSQLSVQAYVFDTYERELLVQSLLQVIEEEDDLAQIEQALKVLFHFQHPDLATANEQPAKEVLFPVVVLTQVLRSLVALPIPVVYRFADVNNVLQPSEYGFEYGPNDFYDFELSNRMRADAVMKVWTDGETERIPQIEQQLRVRVWGTDSVIKGLRERLEEDGVLFAYPPKLFLPDSFGFSEPLLSRLAFIAQYEKVLSYLDIRGRRMKTLEERLADGDTYELTFEGDDWYQMHPRHQDPDVDPGDFNNHILTLDTEEGRRGRLAYDDFFAFWAPKNHAVAIAGVRDTVEVEEGWRLRIELDHKDAFTPPRPGDRCFLEPHFTDWTTKPVIAALADHDDEDDSWFIRLLRDPVGSRGELAMSGGLRSNALGLAREQGMTSSQLEAFTRTLAHDIQLVWGPPGTGKTHFLALAILCIAEAYRQAGLPLRVLVTAMSHPAIDNVLAKIRELQDAAGVFDGRLPLRKLNSSSGGVAELRHKEAGAWAAANEICVLGSTVWQARKVEPAGLRYDLLVIDEGSQVKVGEAAIPFLRLADGARVLIAGDDKQLPPIVAGDYPEPDDEPLLHRSILECLRGRVPEHEMTAPLLENWRMCDVLCEYPASSIYPEGYSPATPAIASRRLVSGSGESEFARAVLDPDFPMVVCVLEDVQATAENLVEASLVAQVTAGLRERFPRADDETFWREHLFIVSPHHVQIRAIRRALADGRTWDRRPFVDTVDKMQGQECDAVIVSYGVSDVEYALGEKEFIYSLNRLNVAITRARAKSIVFLPRPLLEPPIQALESDRAAEGITYMQGLANWCRGGEELTFDLGYGGLTVLRR